MSAGNWWLVVLHLKHFPCSGKWNRGALNRVRFQLKWFGVMRQREQDHLLFIESSRLCAGGEPVCPGGGPGAAGASGGQWACSRGPAQGAERAGNPARPNQHWAASGPAASGPANPAAVWGEPGPQGGACQLGSREGGLQTCSRSKDTEKRTHTYWHVNPSFC